MAQDGRPTISIQLADGVFIYGVDLQLLSLLSSCARGLPSDAQCWDLSQLLVEGRPVQRPTVIAYLNSAYQCVYGEPFREAPQLQHAEQGEPAAQQHKKRKLEGDQQRGEPEQQAGEPEQQQAPAQAAAGITTFTAMTQLLLFADAVGSTAPLLRACAAGLDKLCLQVQLPTQGPLDLSIKIPYFWDDSGTASSSSLAKVTEDQDGIVMTTFSSADALAAETALVQQVQAQTEALLYAAYKLQLSDVAEAVQGFIRMQTCFEQSLLWGAMRPVLSPRVMDAAAGCRSLQETLLLNHLVTEPCSFAGGSVPTALVPTDLPEGERQPWKFTVAVVRDLFGSSRQQQPRVPVEADILQNTLKFGIQTYQMHPVLGHMVCTEQAKQVMLGPTAPSAD